MKRLFASIAFAFAIVTTPTISVVTTGCQSQQRIVVNTLFTIGRSVDAAYKGFNDAVIAGKVSNENLVKVAKLYTKFQTEFNLAIDAVQGNLQANAPTVVTQSATDLTSAIAISISK